METPIALHSVAHRVSHQIPADSESEVSRQNRATPQIKVSHLSPDPLSRTFLSRSQQAGGQRGGGCLGVLEGIAALFGSENGSCYRGVSQLQSPQSRYFVQLSVKARLRETLVIFPSDFGRNSSRDRSFRQICYDRFCSFKEGGSSLMLVGRPCLNLQVLLQQFGVL